eukprot:SAG31_NODE_8431_length_1453_cov_1.991137_1_plen_134_part_00
MPALRSTQPPRWPQPQATSTLEPCATLRSASSGKNSDSLLLCRPQPSVGLVGHVFTAAEHRRKGLAKAAVAAVMAAHEKVGGKHWLLGTGSAGAAKIYQSLGFGHLAGGLDGSAAAPANARKLSVPDCTCLSN